MSFSEGWLLFQVVVDLVLIGFLIHLLYLRRGYWKEMEQKWQKMTRSMEESLSRSNAAAEDLFHGLDERIVQLRRLLGQTEASRKALDKYIGKAQETLSKLTEAASNTWGNEIPAVYEEVIRLSKQGIGPEQIAGRTGLSPGEIELILQLRQLRG